MLHLHRFEHHQPLAGGDRLAFRHIHRDDLARADQARGDEAPSVAIFGDGWYPKEEGFGRWAQTPAKLLVYSPVTQPVRVTAPIKTLSAPSGSRGLGPEGAMLVSVEGDPPTRVAARAGSALSAPLLLR